MSEDETGKALGDAHTLHRISLHGSMNTIIYIPAGTESEVV
jgi:hypothetical protein